MTAYLSEVNAKNQQHIVPPTEQEGAHGPLEGAGVRDLVSRMHDATHQAWEAVGRALPAIEEVIDGLEKRMKNGGRLFYIGAGTSGRLGVVDASECPPTFGVEPGRVVGVIAGGDGAIRNAVEGAEDNPRGAWQDLLPYGPTPGLDTVIGIAASGRTPYVVGGIEDARAHGLDTVAIVCNPNSLAAQAAHQTIEIITGPEFVTGSTRLNAGTATKYVLNLLTTITFIRLGHVRGSRMIDMKPSNSKLIERGVRMICEWSDLTAAEAEELLVQTGSVRAALEHLKRLD